MKDDPPHVKPLLYVYRVLLTGIHLMRSGEIEANLLALNQRFRLPYVSELVARKVSGSERGVLDSTERDFHANEYNRLVGELEQAALDSKLPDAPSVRGALNDILIRMRLGRFSPGSFP